MVYDKTIKTKIVSNIDDSWFEDFLQKIPIDDSHIFYVFENLIYQNGLFLENKCS